MKNLMGISRLLGILALLVSHWYLGLPSLAMLWFIKTEYKLSRLLVDLITHAAAAFGFWSFPFLHATGHILALVQGALIVVPLVRLTRFLPVAFREHRHKNRVQAIKQELLAQARVR